jgi:hypothetical protein
VASKHIILFLPFLNNDRCNGMQFDNQQPQFNVAIPVNNWNYRRSNCSKFRMICNFKRTVNFFLVPIPCIIEYIKTDQQMH